ncbi:hypothetical protein V1509DRAFT_569516, partial [Lipomyces kononenkoae]
KLFKTDKDVWDGIAKTYKNIRCHKNNVLHFRDILREVLDGAQATGQSALSVYSNSSATPNVDPALAETQGYSSQSLSKSSDRNWSDNEDDTKKPHKRQKVDLAQAVTTIVEELRRSRTAKQNQRTVQETAVDILYRDYESRLDTGAFVEAVNVLESESKARIFTRLRADEKRDWWLEVAIGTDIFSQCQAEEM